MSLIDVLFDGLSIGAVLLIVALGLAIVFGLMGVINLAHGELMMFGAYTTYVVQNVFNSLGDGISGFYIWAALPLAFIVAALVGLVLERGVIRFLYGRPLETLLATWGVSLILRQFVRSANWAMVLAIAAFCLLFLGGRWLLNRTRRQPPPIATLLLLVLSAGIGLALGALFNRQSVLSKLWFGPRNVDVTAPSWLQGSWSPASLFSEEFRTTNEWAQTLGLLDFPTARLFIVGLTIVCIVGVYWFLQGSAWGLRIRSVTQNRNMSACLGIPTERVDALTFALGSGLAGIAGFAVTLLGSVGPNLGGNYIVDAFMVVVVGGVGKLVGSIVAALLIGIVSYLVGSGTLGLLLPSTEIFQPALEIVNFFATSSMAKVLVFALIIAFLQIKPAGLFPQKGRSVEA
ncbi:MAG: branched-chain amino acid ABC transporter permease [Leptolyngbya sp. SIO4C1]|nr:branched-chain amino acid ABC transporter permease [Leptolyngbya sp. SIO4C1]